MEQDKVSKLSDVGKNVWAEDSDRRNTMEPDKKKVSYRQRWDEAQPTKKVVFWACIGADYSNHDCRLQLGRLGYGGTAQEMAG